MHERAPVLIGVAQAALRDQDPRRAPGPDELMAQVAGAAAEDAGIGPRAWERLDTLGVVDVIAWRPRNPPRLVAERLGARPARQLLTALGGESPLRMLNQVAAGIAAGRSRMALLAGVNLVKTLARARRERVRLEWSQGGEGTPELVGKNLPGSSPRELAHGLARPSDVYPIFENALRAARGLDLATHARRMGQLCARMSEVAAANPNAWFPVKRSAEELVTVTPRNRMIAFPYPKYLNAVMETDQAAALLVTSAGEARALGVPAERLVHWWSGARAVEEAWFPSERPDLAASPALAASAGTALARAGLRVEEIDLFDLYSCFPSAVEVACEAVGIAEDDPRGVTVTGGLPYAGGPGNAYCLHAVASMVERLREGVGRRGLVTGNGWYLTKHAATVLASQPLADLDSAEISVGDVSPTGASVEIADRPEGPGRVETYTVLYDREGAPARGIVVGRLAGGERFLANTPDDRALLTAFAAEEAVGRTGRVAPGDERNLFSPD